MGIRGALVLLVLFAGFSGWHASAQLSEEQKRALFLKAREDIRPVPRPQASPSPRPKPRPVATPRPTPRSTPRPTPAPTPAPAQPPDDNDVIPLEKEVTPTPRPRETKEPEPAATPEPRATPDKKTPPPPSRPAPSPRSKDVPIVIEKSGLADERGYEPPPSKARSGGWFKRYRYLTPAVRRAIDQAPIRKGQWQYIIIHNSGTRQGNARIFGNYHLNVRKMKNGLAYHFVIGNGNSSGDGEVEIGSRWTRQINGGHVASDYLNSIALGICLVGDLNRDKPTAAQLAAIEELVDYLRSRVGKTKGKPAAVRGHKQINPKPTDCPGDRFDLRWLRRRFGW